jgi:4-aminobutyrate aminotransferase-like enzyme
MGSGMPLSGVVSTKKILDLPEQGELSSTNSANPLVCSAGLATLNVMSSSKFLNSLERNCKIFDLKLNEIESNFKGRIRVFGKGMIKAIVFFDKNGNPDIKSANEVVDELLLNRLLVVKTGRESIKLGPPLNMRKKNLIKGLEIINKSLKKILNDTL